MANMKIGCRAALYTVFMLLIQLTGVSANWNSEDSVIREYDVAVGKIPASPDFLNFNLTPLNSYGLLYNGIETGKKYCIVQKNNTHTYISRFLVENNSFYINYYTDFAKKKYNYTKTEYGILALPEGFAISVQDVDNSNNSAIFSITHNGREIDKRAMREGDFYEYVMDLNGQKKTLMSFKLERLTLTMGIDDQPLLYSVDLGSFRLISPDIHEFDLTSADRLNQHIYDVYKDGGDETLNFSINDARRIPATSFIYETSIYRKDRELEIAWLGQPFRVINHNASSIKISRWLVDSHKISIVDGETLILPEGFSITVLEIDTRNNPRSARFLIMRNGEKLDDMVLKTGDDYEYKMGLNGSDFIWIMKFNLDSVFSGSTIDLIQLKTFQLISPEILDIKNGDTIYFRPDIVSISGEPYYVIDRDDKSIYLSRLLVDDRNTHNLMKGNSIDLPGGFNITLLATNPAWDGKGGRIHNDDLGYGRFLIKKNGKEIDNVSVKTGERYEYGVGRRILSFVVEAVGGKYDYRSDYGSVKIGSIRLYSPEARRIEKGTDALEGYRTDILNGGKTVKVSLTNDIDLVEGRTEYLMGNWFGIRVRSDSAAVAMINSNEQAGALEYLVYDRTDFNLTSEKNPAVLFFDPAGSSEKLNFSIKQECSGCDLYISGGSLAYTTTTYHASDGNRIAWFTKPYSVIENTASGFIISKLLLDEDENDYHLLETGKSLALKDGFVLKLVDIDIILRTAKFSLIKDHAEVNSSILKEGDIYQYMKDLKGNGKDDSWLVRFNVKDIYTENKTVIINGVRMISPQILRINNGVFIENSRIKIGKDANTIEIRNGPGMDIFLKNDDATDILNDAFYIRIYRNSNAAAVMKSSVQKSWNVFDQRRSSRELDELKTASIVNASVTDIQEAIETPEETIPAKGVSSPGIFEIILALLITRYISRRAQ